MRGDKSPGSDGFNTGLFKMCWNTIKEDFVAFLNEFCSSSILPKAIIASFLTLILKVDNDQEVSEFRPIYLISSLHKIVAKVIPSLISSLIFDGVCALNLEFNI